MAFVVRVVPNLTSNQTIKYMVKVWLTLRTINRFKHHCRNKAYLAAFLVLLQSRALANAMQKVMFI